MPTASGSERVFSLEFSVEGMDFAATGDVAGNLKRALQQIGLDPVTVRRACIVVYEAETNIVIHAYRGRIRVEVSTEGIFIVAEDEGPGIADVELAMKEGYSTAPQHVREMGFGAGMGLPNIRRSADELEIQTKVGVGTKVQAVINIGRPGNGGGS
jgi:anti-sigma regulatory factor (Ser/Thr protein kinase)